MKKIIVITSIFISFTSCTFKDKSHATLKLMNHQLIESTKDMNKLNQELYETFNKRVRDSIPYASLWQQKALSIKLRSDSICINIFELKKDFIMKLEKLSIQKQVDMSSTNWIKNKNNLKTTYNYFIKEGNATKLLHYLEEYNSQLAGIIKPKDTLEIEILWKSLLLYPDFDNYIGKPNDWELENFENITAIEAITNLTFLQNRIRTAEHLVVSYLINEYLN